MVGIKVLIENSTTDKRLKPRHGLSLLINTGESCLLLDTGSGSTFVKNAAIMNADLSSIRHLVLSHSHMDHTGGLDHFARINPHAAIYLADNPDNKYYYKIFNFIYMPVGLKAKKHVRRRIKTPAGNTKISNDAWIINNTVSTGFKPSLNSLLFMKKEGRMVPDDFQHEVTLVIVDGKELVIFNSCSHTGVTNIIESVMTAFPGYEIRSFIGGMHLCNPANKKNEDAAAVEKLGGKLAEYGIRYYTGHCTGDVSFNILKKAIGDRIEVLSTGMELYV